MALYKGNLERIEKNVAFFNLRDEENDWEVRVHPERLPKLVAHIGSELYFVMDTAGFIVGFCPAYLWCNLLPVEEKMERADSELDENRDESDY
mgnify:CR=1 FL=1